MKLKRLSLTGGPTITTSSLTSLDGLLILLGSTMSNVETTNHMFSPDVPSIVQTKTTSMVISSMLKDAFHTRTKTFGLAEVLAMAV